MNDSEVPRVTASATNGSVLAPRTPWQRRGSMVQDAGLVVLSAVFFYANVRQLVVTGSVTSVFFAAEQGLLVGVFLARRRTSTTSSRPMDWAVATIGGWLPLVLRPGGEGYSGIALAGVSIQMLGLALTMAGFFALGRSFGIVAANRGVKVSGPYRLLRHPIYFAEFVTSAGFLLANFTIVNAAVVAVVALCQVARIHAEERVLSQSAEYRAYTRQVHWRLLPGVY